ncbi:hypothetical protein [Natrinema ejinorense]|uniref:hypothetical protein n=1 Tax=Natrinema ejinorense TaxID=373386 RepID=UPI00117EF5C1|nr:hypothetical protein [Natrinema ejinorense]
MECVICGEDRRSKGSLMEMGPPMESVGVICQRCFRGLKNNRPDSMGCGYNTEDKPCLNEADYATKTLERLRRVGEVTSEATEKPDELLLCEEHFEKIENGEKPLWLPDRTKRF